MRWYLVGGAVRDLLLGRTPQERDMAFTGDVQDFLREYPQARAVGRGVEVCLLDGVECMPLRGGSLEADLRARDLTINALAVDEHGRLFAHPEALADLTAGVLRPASPQAFAQDPARVFRLARFAATFPDFTLHAEALAQARQARHMLPALPAERVGNEVRKALRAARPSRFAQVLDQAGVLSPWLAELEGAAHVPAGPAPRHTGTVLEHVSAVMDAAAGDELAVWMALCHDLGKTATDPRILPHHYGHETRGAVLAQALGRRLALPARHIRAGVLAALLHMKGGRFHVLRPGTRRDLLHAVHSAGLDQPFWKMVDADAGADVSGPALRALKAMLEARLPPEWRNRGKASGERLRALQCRRLALCDD